MIVSKKYTRYRFSLFALILGFGLTLGFGFFSGEPASAAEANATKTLRLQEKDIPFEVSFEPVKSTFQTGEAIRFHVQASKRFFLYLYSINQEENEAVLLIPGKKQQGNMYPANELHVVPNPGLEFYADNPGQEKIVMIASTKYLDLETKGYSQKGQFLRTTPKKAQKQIKALSLRPKEPKAEQVVQDLQVEVLGPRVEVAAQDQEEAEPMAFVACDRETYQLEDIVRVVFGATQAGWVHLFTIDPDGSKELLKKQEVSGETIYQLKAQATPPSGTQALMAVYSEDPAVETKSLPAFADQTQTKGLSLIEPEQPPYAVYRFHITEN